VHWESNSLCLLPQQLTAHSVHSYTFKPLVDRRKQPYDLYVWPLAQCVQCVGTVFATAPGEPYTQRRLLIR